MDLTKSCTLYWTFKKTFFNFNNLLIYLPNYLLIYLFILYIYLLTYFTHHSGWDERNINYLVNHIFNAKVQIIINMFYGAMLYRELSQSQWVGTTRTV